MSHSGDKKSSSAFLAEGLRSVTGLVARRPRVALWLVGLSVCISVVFTVGYLRFRTDRADLIDPQADFHERWLSYIEDFGAESDIVVVAEADDPVAIRETLDALGTRLEAEEDTFRDVLYKIEPNRLQRKGLQFTSTEALRTGLNRVDRMRPVLQGNWDYARLDQVSYRLRRDLEYTLQNRPATAAGEAAYNARMAELLEHTERLGSSLSRFNPERNQYYLPWPDLVPVEDHLRSRGQSTQWMLNSDGTLGFLKVRPTDAAIDGFSGAAPAIDRLREIIAEVQADRKSRKLKSVSLGLTGIPVLEADEMRASSADMLKASLISLAGVGLLLFIGFRSFRHPFLAMVMLMVGMAWAFGYTTLVVGHLNILSISFAAILIGLGIDFAIHYLARYLELRQYGEDLHPALCESSSTVGVGIVAAAVTTALAFFCATMTQFLGVAELGIIAGGGILLCCVATFVVLPALVSLSDSNKQVSESGGLIRGDFISGLTFRLPFLVCMISLGVVIGCAASVIRFEDGEFTPRLTYDHNLLNLQAEGLESVELQKKISEKHHDSVLYAVSIADSPQEAKELRARFEALPTVAKVEELGSRLPGPPSRETQVLVQAYQSKLSRLPAKPDKQRLLISAPAPIGDQIERLYLTLRKVSRAPIDYSLTQVAAQAANDLDVWLDRFANLDVWKQTAMINEFQVRMTLSLWGQLKAISTAADPSPISLADFPPELRDRFVSKSGKWLVQVHPKEEIWEIEPLQRFVNDVRSVDPLATGTPLQNYEASEQIKTSYEKAALYALAIILVVLLLDFLQSSQKALVLLPPLGIVGFFGVMQFMNGTMPSPQLLIALYIGAILFFAALLDSENLRDAILAMVPPVAGGLMMFGIMGLLGMSLNPANLIVLPLVLGIGVDDGVHIVHDFRNQGAKYRTGSSTMNSIILTSLTSMTGFGSMLIASHRGLYSVGMTLVIGVACCLFVSLVTLPAILTLIDRRENGSTSKGSAREDEDYEDDVEESNSRRNRKRRQGAA